MVEPVPSKRRRLCPDHFEAIGAALATPGTYTVHWGMTPEERTAALRARLVAAQARWRELGPMPDEHRVDPHVLNRWYRAQADPESAIEDLERGDHDDPFIDVSPRKR
jgi:hypothetical protein